MKKGTKLKLKLTKSTIADLNRFKGGSILCGCQVTTTDAAHNYEVVHTLAQTVCIRTCLHDPQTNCY